MGTYGIFLVIVLVLVSGLIAYVGDILGRRLGRRRVTIFGLRPRYTAIVFSVVAGMLITLLTLFAAAALSEKVRVGLTQVDVIRDQLRTLESKAKASNKQLENARKRTQQAEQARKAALASLEAARKEMKQVGQRLQQAKTETARVTKRLETSQNKLQEVEKQFSFASLELKKQKEQLKNGEEVAMKAGRALLETTRQRDKLSQQKDTLNKEVADLRQQADSLHSETEDLRAQLSRLKSLAEAATPTLTGEVILQVGEEVGREVIDSDQPIASIRQELQQFLHGLEKRVKEAGAGEDAQGRAIILARAALGAGNNGIQPNEEGEMLEMLARQIHAPSGSVIVRAFSLLNVARGRPVPVDLALVPNRLLFKKGEKLAEISLNPARSETELLAEIIWWLREKVSTRARQENMLSDLPAAGEKALLFGSPSRPVGRIGPEQLFAVLKQVKGRRSPVRIVASAAKDTWTAGPLQVELETTK